MAGFTRDGVCCQYCVIEHAGHLITGRIVAEIACDRNTARRRVRMWRRILSGDRYAICHCAHAVMAAGLTAGARYNDRRIGMVRKGRGKCRGGVAIVTFHGNTRMARQTGIGAGTNCDGAIMTRRTWRGYI
jgi:hypothetical protein